LVFIFDYIVVDKKHYTVSKNTWRSQEEHCSRSFSLLSSGVGHLPAKLVRVVADGANLILRDRNLKRKTSTLAATIYQHPHSITPSTLASALTLTLTLTSKYNI
jgi:hypothetical protein